MRTTKSPVLFTFILALSLLLCVGSAFAGSDGSPAGEPGSACAVSTEQGIPLDGTLVLNFTHFHCSNPTPGACGTSADVAHVKATLRFNYSKFNNNNSKMQTYTFNAFLGKDVNIIDPCNATSLVVAKLSGPVLKQLFNITDPTASGARIRLREPYANNIDYTIDLNAKPGTYIFAPDDYNEERPITSFTNVVDFKGVVLGF